MFENLITSLLIFASTVGDCGNDKTPSAADAHGLVSFCALCSVPLPGSPYDFISLDWLQKWLDESTPPKPIDNSACLCSHGKLHPDKIPIMKRISEYVADFFYRRYGGGPRLNGEESGWKTPSPSHFLTCHMCFQPHFEPLFISKT